MLCRHLTPHAYSFYAENIRIRLRKLPSNWCACNCVVPDHAYALPEPSSGYITDTVHSLGVHTSLVAFHTDTAREYESTFAKRSIYRWCCSASSPMSGIDSNYHVVAHSTAVSLGLFMYGYTCAI
ncbi:hypothetical protein SARC_09642 [Sphaeroforma arctica JP610]|uniref:Uncharacterized protein n=1 Tax=Sphaeroforma arctica JP610 TaxID=667725 RepID=A0A0L0FMB0_9EUKA|nr:hypothetical protein SARC_09642 [Sphaeroforma arctica JP610]KNC77907.1 hypothetical protein SARC_09642 [Sphaeroforma arctica JP610]|eukprot:XP_014151809.1 hypothetical protein SARC_09642 [Sphaeroforma arctica JP610]